MGTGFKKKQQVSTAKALDNLINGFNGLLNKLEVRDKEFLFYFAAITDSLAEAFPDKFRGEDGKPIDIYKRYIEKKVAQMEVAQEVAKGTELVVTGLPSANG